MSIKLRPLLLAAAGIAQLACAESVGPRDVGIDLDIVVPKLTRPSSETELSPNDLLVPYEDDPSGSGETPSGTGEIPPEFQLPPTISSYSSDAGFGSSAAWGQAGMRYFGSHAKQSLTLTLRFNNAQVAAPTVTSLRSSLYPYIRDLFTSTEIGLQKNCGHIADARGEHTAWHKLPIPVGQLSEWGHVTESSSKSAAQSACTPEDGAVAGSGGGGPAWYVCYCMDYYSSATGEWVHGGIIYCAGA